MKTGSSVFKFPGEYGPVLKKFQSAIIFAIFGRLPKEVTAYVRPYVWYFALGLIEICWKRLKE